MAPPRKSLRWTWSWRAEIAFSACGAPMRPLRGIGTAPRSGWFWGLGAGEQVWEGASDAPRWLAGPRSLRLRDRYRASVGWFWGLGAGEQVWEDARGAPRWLAGARSLRLWDFWGTLRFARGLVGPCALCADWRRNGLRCAHGFRVTPCNGTALLRSARSAVRGRFPPASQNSARTRCFRTGAPPSCCATTSSFRPSCGRAPACPCR